MNFLFRIVYRFYRLVSWALYWARRRFTRAGLAILGVALIAMMMGPDTDNNIVYQGFTLLFFTIMVAWAFSLIFRIKVAAERHLPRFGTVGCPFYYTVRLRNLSPRTQHGLTLLENLVDPRPAFPDWLVVQLAEARQLRSFRMSRPRRVNPYHLAEIKEGSLPSLPPRQETGVQLELVPLRRGMLRFSGLTIARADPLGLFRAFHKVPLPQTAMILPKRYHVPPLALPGTMKYQEGGVAMASHVGQSEEFVALRDYRYGDPLRHIHWRSWAKTGKPVVREFEDEFFVRHALILDTFIDHPYSELFEEAVSVAASFASTLETQESLLDLLFVGSESFCFTAGRGLAHADQMLEVLASVRPCREARFNDLQALVIQHVSLVSGCICVFLAWDALRRDLVGKLRALNVPSLVLVLAEQGAAAFDPGPMIDVPERFRVLELGRIEQDLMELA